MALHSLMQDDWPLVVSRIIDYAARWHGDQVVICRTTEGYTSVTTYADVHRRSAQCSLALRDLGVRPGDRVATLAWNTTRHLESWYGIAGVGAVCHTVNPRLFEKDIEYIIQDAEDTVIMADITFIDMLVRMLPKLPAVRHVVLLTDPDHMPPSDTLKSVCYERIIDVHKDDVMQGRFSWYPSKETDACGLCYTSGTTGKPKGVMYGHRSNFLHAMAMCMPDGLDLKAKTCFLMVVVRMICDERSSVYVSLYSALEMAPHVHFQAQNGFMPTKFLQPMFHANSWGTAFGVPLVGGKLILPGPHLDGKSIFELIETYKVTHSGGVPTVWQSVKEYVDASITTPCFKSLQIVVIGGSACPKHLIQYYQNKHNVEVRHMWGMTELSPNGCFGTMKGTLPDMSEEQQTELKLKQGRPHIFCEYRIVDEMGNELPFDGKTPGNLQVRGPTAIKRYYKKQEDCVCEGNWFDTGDIATVDSNGYMLIKDRSKDVIKSGGEWISSIEIENIVAGFPGVSEAAIIGIKDAKWGERPLLVVVKSTTDESLASRVTKESLLGFLDGRIAKWWMPDDVVFVKEIPHTATGKIQKLTLREMFKDFIPSRSHL